MKNKCKRQIKHSKKKKKRINKNCDKLSAKWKGYDNLFNIWINKKYVDINIKDDLIFF